MVFDTLYKSTDTTDLTHLLIYNLYLSFLEQTELYQDSKGLVDVQGF